MADATFEVVGGSGCPVCTPLVGDKFTADELTSEMSAGAFHNGCQHGIEKVGESRAQYGTKPLAWDDANWGKDSEAWSRAWGDLKLTDAQREAAQNYTRGFYSSFNGELRGGVPGRHADQISALQSAIGANRAPSAIKVQRSSDIFGGHKIHAMDDAAFASLKGEVVTETGFVSTVASGEAPALSIVINVPKGGRAMWVEPITAHKGEFEVILGHGQQFVVDSADIVDGARRLTVTLVDADA